MRVLLTNNITWRLCFRAFQFNEVIPLLLGSELFIRRKGLCWRGSLSATGHRGSCTDGLIPAFSAPLTNLVPTPSKVINIKQPHMPHRRPPLLSSVYLNFYPRLTLFFVNLPRPVLFTFSFTLHLASHPRLTFVFKSLRFFFFRTAFSPSVQSRC